MARNHLHAFRVQIDARQMYPEVPGTLIRGALLGAVPMTVVLTVCR